MKIVELELHFTCELMFQYKRDYVGLGHFAALLKIKYLEKIFEILFSVF